MNLIEKYTKLIELFERHLSEHEKKLKEAREEKHLSEIINLFELVVICKTKIEDFNQILNDLKKEQIKIISQTEASAILGKTKAEVHQMVLDGQLKNWGNEYRFMVNEFEVKKLLKGNF